MGSGGGGRGEGPGHIIYEAHRFALPLPPCLAVDSRKKHTHVAAKERSNHVFFPGTRLFLFFRFFFFRVSCSFHFCSCCCCYLHSTRQQQSVSSDGTNTARSARQTADRTEWYMTTGQALITTIAINVVAPRGPDLVEYFVLGPWRRRSASAASAVTQRQLNKSWKGTPKPKSKPFLLKMQKI